MKKTKTTIRVQKQPGKFVTFDKGFLDDSRLGTDGMGLHAWMLARPDDWKFHISQIAASTGTPLNRIRASMKRLSDCGYILRQRVTDRKTGRVIRWDMIVFETPALAATAKAAEPSLFEAFDKPKAGRKEGQKTQKPHSERNTPDVENPDSGNPDSGYPGAGNPDSGKCTLLKTNVTKIDSDLQQRTNEQPPAIAPAGPPVSDRLPASAGESGDRVAAAEPSVSAGAGVGSGDVVVEKSEEIVSSLVKRAYFPASEAIKLVGQHGEVKCRQALACLAQVRKPPTNRRGFVIRAIQEDWEPNGGPSMPIAPSAPKLSEAEVLAGRQKAEQEMEVRRQRDGTLNALTDAEWATFVERLRPRLGPTILRMLEAGRSPRTITTLQDLVYIELTRRVAG